MSKIVQMGLWIGMGSVLVVMFLVSNAKLIFLIVPTVPKDIWDYSITNVQKFVPQDITPIIIINYAQSVEKDVENATLY